MFCLQIHARAKCIMNEKFCILHEAAGAEKFNTFFLFLVFRQLFIDIFFNLLALSSCKYIYFDARS